MPYIDDEMKMNLDDHINKLVEAMLAQEENNLNGQLNYVITRLLSNTHNIDINPRYNKINDVIGILECAKLEFYNRVARPYEDSKININGDVHEYSQFDETMKGN